MERYYYLNSNNEQAGPVSPDEFSRYGVTESTMIWKQGMQNWIRAGQIPELSQYFMPVPPPVPPVGNNNNGGNNYGGNNNYSGNYGGNNYGANNYGGNNQYKPIKPDNNMLWAILTTLFCCLPFGIYSIIQASKVNGLYNSGMYDEAQRMADDAKKWAGVGALIGLVVNVIYVGIIVANS